MLTKAVFATSLSDVSDKVLSLLGAEVFLGSVSHNMIRHSEAPVMLVPGRP